MKKRYIDEQIIRILREAARARAGDAAAATFACPARRGPIRSGAPPRPRSGTSHAWYHMVYNLVSIDADLGVAMSLVTPEAVAAVMELRPLPHTLAELEALVRDGLPKSALRAGVEHATQGADARRALLARIIPEATYKRRRDRLTQDESEKTERLARIVATTTYVWNDEEDAREFLSTPHPELEGRAPLDVALTELGARRVEELLWKLFYGLPA